jgi:hypothetical protein
LWESETWRHYSDNVEIFVGDSQRGSAEVRSSTKHPPPKVVTDQDDGIATGLAFVRGKRTTNQRLCAEHSEKIG